MILVTGGAGYVGSHVVLACLDAGRQVAVLDDLSTGHADAVPDGVPFYWGDCGDTDLIARIWRERDIRFVVHLAARTVVPESVADPLGYYAANAGRTRALLSFLSRHRPDGLVFSSTAAVYGVPPAPLVDETAPLRPVSPYGRSKLICEWMIEDAARAHGLRAIALRFFNVAGADPAGRAGQRTPGATHLLKRVCEVAAGRRPVLEICGTDYDTPDGTCIRDFIHVSDLARAHLAALDLLGAGGTPETLNCGYGTGISVAQAARAAGRITGRTLPVSHGPRRPGDVPAIVADSSRLKRVLDWTPRHQGIEEILGSALRYEMSLPGERAA